MAEAGVGLAIAPESVARHYARTMRIAVVALADTWAIRERYLITRAEARTPATLRDLIVRIRAHHGTRGRLQIAAPALAEPATAT
jgi:DNA-binding transcriptional LysR family regulator